MSDLVVVALIPARPGSEETVRAALRTLTAATREEAGCHGYDLYESSAAAGTFVTVERWADRSDLDAHMSSPHMADAVASMGQHLAGAPVIHTLAPVDVQA